MTAMTAAVQSAGFEPSRAVRTRRVYYISGFDPRGPSYYHRLYREEAAKQGIHHDGAAIVVGRRQRVADHVHAWRIDSEWQGRRVSTDYQFLAWDDIVRRHWEPNRLKLAVGAIGTYARYIACGAFSGIRKNFKGPLYAALYPIALLASLATLALLGAYVVASAVSALFGSTWLALSIAIATSSAIGWAGLRLIDGAGSLWLLRLYGFITTWGAKGIDGMDARIDEFVERIKRDQAQQPCDEVLVIGHSVGSILAVCVAARLSRALPGEDRSNLALLTLGQCIPLLSLMPTATAFREELAQLAAAGDMVWLDMIARADALCFSQANPLDISGITGQTIGRPVQQVVRPFRMFNAAEYARLRRDKLRLHFQYLMASALPNEYDYFRMTAGPSRIKSF